MTKTKPDIKEFDNLSITDLLNVPTKALTIAIFIKVKQQNGKLNFHDKFIWTFLGILITGFVGGLITYFVLRLIG